ncbi:fibroblast growth factor receptor homolog 1 [Musca domestica]|uniref:receptor protein-tyrosine kinase n=1 Tax=Musca domestica TaxID=7370 RepID=A0A1I8M2A8_MUSDO|nr:fibroblast growth factor receptor homolog 1 [Musca domestica]
MRNKGSRSSVMKPIVLLFAVIIVCEVDIGSAKSVGTNSAGYEKNIQLVANAMQFAEVNLNQTVNVVCPFEQRRWYYNETPVAYADRNLSFEMLAAEQRGVYGCLTAQKENIDRVWANVTIIVCAISCKHDNTSNVDSKANINAESIRHLNGYPKFENNKFSSDVTKQSGDYVTFSCVPLAPSSVNLTWLVNNSPIDVDKSKAAFKKWTLSISNLDISDSGTYTCQLCNNIGCVYRSTLLRVVKEDAVRPKIVVNGLKNQSVHMDENVTFECHVETVVETQITWLKHDTPINETLKPLDVLKDSNMRRMVTQFDTPHLLRLGSVQEEDEGWYTCIATNSFDGAMASAYLCVITTTKDEAENKDGSGEMTPILNSLNLEQADTDESSDHELEPDNRTPADESKQSPPEFKNVKKLIQRLHKPAGSSVQLLCPATGNPTPNITWTLNDTAIERHMGKVTYKKWSMQMDDAITKDSGVYKCRICNVHGCIEHSTKITIIDRLRSSPIISDKFPQNQTALVYSSTTLECRVVSDLEPFIYWLKYVKKNESIEYLEKIAQNFDVHQSTNKTNDIIVLNLGQDKSNILNFSRVTHDDEGWYSCVAATSLGLTVASAYLKVVDKLPLRDGLQRSHPAWITTVGAVVVLLFLLGTVFIIYVLRNLKQEKLLKQRIETVHQWTKKVIIYKPPPSDGSTCDLQMPVIKIEKQRTTFTTSTNSDPNQGFNEYEFPLDSNWEIPRSQLSLGSTLGEGAFGRVVMAQASGLTRAPANNNVSTIVAVKMVKEEHTDADMASLVREMEVMKMIGKHINIINLLGCCSQNGPLWVIVEFAPHGNLKDFLKKNRPNSVWGSCSLKERDSDYLEETPVLTEKQLTSFAFQIARGMEYLASRRCIHRDLAARNVLVSDDYVMKIADFGLARDIQDTDYYRKNTNGRLPIKWMAPESLQEKFYDSQSDVWSYGVLLWEILTYGEQPYPNIMSAEELYSYLITGQRMEKPPRCSLNIYMLMRQCWHFDSNARPTFSEIVENLDKILQLSSTMPHEEYLDLSMPMLETPPSSSDEESESETFLESPSARYQYTYKFK